MSANLDHALMFLSALIHYDEGLGVKAANIIIELFMNTIGQAAAWLARELAVRVRRFGGVCN